MSARTHIGIVLGVISALWCVNLPLGTCQAQASPAGATDAQHALGRPAMTEAQSIRADRIADSIMSPFCPGKTLNSCPSPDAAQWRSDIRKWVQQGESSTVIKKRLQSRAPDAQLSSSPPTYWDWLVPMLAFSAASALLIVYLRRMHRSDGINSRSTQKSDPLPQEQPDEYEKRLDRELSET